MRILILVAEDEKDLALLYKQILEGRNHEVIITNDGQECIDVFRKDHNFDVVVLDYQMPKKNGLDTAKEILFWKPKQRIIFASAYVTSILEKAVKNLHMATELLQKPFNINTLVETIEDKKLYQELVVLNTGLVAVIDSINPDHDQLKSFVETAAKVLAKRRTFN